MSNFLEELERCARCGKCRTVCPVFGAIEDETRLARGRIALLKAYLSGKIEASGDLEDIVSSCMKCRQCENVCPSNVKLLPALLAVKERLSKNKSAGSAVRFFMDNVVTDRKRYDLAVRTAAAAGKLLPRVRGAKLRHLPLLSGGRRRLPEIAPESALSKYPEVTKPRGEVKGRVGLFLGCLNNYVTVHVADAVINVLAAGGYEVVIPKDQVCCGLAAVTLGEKESARKLARLNEKAFEGRDLDFVVSACATGTGMIDEGFGEFLDMPDALGAPVKDFVEVLDIIDIPLRRLDLVTTYHDPCHHTHRGIHDAPRRLLKRVSDFREMENASKCCGGGGSFSLFYYETSRKIGEVKTRAVGRLKPDLVVTACPGCMVQLDDLLGGDPPVMHIAEIAAMALDESARGRS